MEKASHGHERLVRMLRIVCMVCMLRMVCMLKAIGREAGRSQVSKPRPDPLGQPGVETRQISLHTRRALHIIRARTLWPTSACKLAREQAHRLTGKTCAHSATCRPTAISRTFADTLYFTI